MRLQRLVRILGSLAPASFLPGGVQTLQRAKGAPQMLGGILHGPIPVGLSAQWSPALPNPPLLPSIRRDSGEILQARCAKSGVIEPFPCFEWSITANTAVLPALLVVQAWRGFFKMRLSFPWGCCNGTTFDHHPP